jgi:hypothetical protein
MGDGVLLTGEVLCQKWNCFTDLVGFYKGNLTDLRRKLHLSLAKGNPKRTL